MKNPIASYTLCAGLSVLIYNILDDCEVEWRWSNEDENEMRSSGLVTNGTEPPYFCAGKDLKIYLDECIKLDM